MQENLNKNNLFLDINKKNSKSKQQLEDLGFSSQTSERICLKMSSLVINDEENFNKNY